MSIGIDYGMGQTNIDTETGIRFGVIHAHDVGRSWYDSSEADYGLPHCPYCGTEAAPYDSDIHDGFNDRETWCDDYACETCGHTLSSDEAFGEDPLGHYYKDDEYFATQSDSDIFIERSPYYTYAPFCSPCAPGAGYLGSAETCDRESGVKTYCFDHAWFEDGKAPYRVFRVSDHTEVLPEGSK